MWIQPVIFVSKCIEHEACRYDGSMIRDPFVRRLTKYVQIVTECPECSIGLPVPREAIRIINDEGTEKLVYSKSGNDVSERMNKFAVGYVDDLKKKSLHGAILKSRSPSCGLKDVKVYKDIGKSPPSGFKSIGFFGRVLLQECEGLAVEDEGRLSNYNIRDHFLTRIYTMASFEQVRKKQTMKSLVEFHSNNKYLLMAYHQMNQRALGKIVANHEKKPIEIVLKEYEELLEKALARPLKRGTNINMLFHLLGYFKEGLSGEEKAYFLDLLEQYSNKKVPMSVPLSLIGAWVVRFNQPYLKNQTIFEPYPKEILDVTDSGKGIK